MVGLTFDYTYHHIISSGFAMPPSVTLCCSYC